MLRQGLSNMLQMEQGQFIDAQPIHPAQDHTDSLLSAHKISSTSSTILPVSAPMKEPELMDVTQASLPSGEKECSLTFFIPKTRVGSELFDQCSTILLSVQTKQENTG